MMQREVTAIVLCILAQAASAQCVATPEATAARAIAVSETVHPGGTAAVSQQPTATRGTTRDLIKTAAAGTRDDAPPTMREATLQRTGTGREDHPRRGGTAMLLAALALMSGIALRRYGARDE